MANNPNKNPKLKQGFLHLLDGVSAIMEAFAIAPEIIAGYEWTDDIFALLSEIPQNVSNNWRE